MKAKRAEELKRLTQSWGISLPAYSSLDQALTHPTYVFENKNRGLEHNQRLEFLGDAVLGMVVGADLYLRFPQSPEGDLTKMRALIVCEASLAERAAALGLGNLLLLGRGEENDGGRERPSSLADAFEAVLGAIYLEVGFETVRTFILAQMDEVLNKIDPANLRDHKTLLQELVQKYGEDGISYLVLEETGPDHKKNFVSGAFYKEKLLARGSGKTKKESEKNAAASALDNAESWRSYLGANHERK